MEAISRIIGLFFSMMVIGRSLAYNGLSVVFYMTFWTNVIATASLVMGLAFKEEITLRRRAGAVAWISTFCGIILYWGYLYPIIQEPIDVSNIFRHGGLLPFLTVEVLSLKMPIYENAIGDTLAISCIYDFGLLVPLGLAGIPVYPGATFRDAKSWVLLVFGKGLIFLGHYLLQLINRK